MTAKVIDLAEYRKRKQDGNAVKRLRGRGFPEDYSPFTEELSHETDHWLAKFFKRDGSDDKPTTKHE